MVLFAEWPLPILQGLPNSHGRSQKWVKLETSVERQEWMALMGTGVFSPPFSVGARTAFRFAEEMFPECQWIEVSESHSADLKILSAEAENMFKAIWSP